ncbi:hypothetical protein FOL47_010558 [Perkinsus chesapeaki]|uniref:Uncharacterized protein n=1 Tax=Perkinsus chesapeaki TaxID=330153 RepID=A0A7J6L3X3_PERCH|nr:hypothetical protein FOL47_010558 [Perkinsus chesapeaki]
MSAPQPDVILQVFIEAISDQQVAEALHQSLSEFGVASLRGLSCLTDGAITSFCQSVDDDPSFSELPEGLLETHVQAVRAECAAQLRHAEANSVPVPSESPRSAPRAQRQQASVDYSASVKRVSEATGPIPSETMPCERMLAAFGGTPWRYVNLTQFFGDSSLCNRGSKSVLAEGTDGTPVLVRDKSDEQTSFRQWGSRWCLAFQMYGWAVLIVQDHANGGESQEGDVKLPDIYAYMSRVLHLTIQFNWKVAEVVDVAVRKKIEASRFLGAGSLGDFFRLPELTAGTVLTALAACPSTYVCSQKKRDAEQSQAGSGPSKRRRSGKRSDNQSQGGRASRSGGDKPHKGGHKADHADKGDTL